LNSAVGFLLAFEFAEKTTDEAARKAAMNFVVIGGGPTGVEMAGAIAEISRYTLAKDFRHIDPSQVRAILIEGGPLLLAAYPEDLSESARKQLANLGVEVHTSNEPHPSGGRTGRQIHPMSREDLGGRNKAVADLSSFLVASGRITETGFPNRIDACSGVRSASEFLF
jgi:pyruvate/2-oxoglutarate dehydrogenase complex dihydrolipoamide dehydrogenase (E3) component